MALWTWHGDMPSGQWKLRGVMACQGIGRGPEAIHLVTTFAAVTPRGAGELPFVDVGVAISALRRLDFVKRIQTLRNVALPARYVAMLPLEWIGCSRMLGHLEGRGLEALNRVTRRALAAILTRIELPVMRVVLMAIQAFLESNRLVKIPSQVTPFAAHPRVFSQQRVLCGGMIEPRTYRGRRDLFPTRRGVTGLAGDLENAVMWVGVAITTSAESQAHVLDNFRMARFRPVALLAWHATVLTRQWVTRVRVVKLGHGLPLFECVAVRAVAAQLAPMLIGMTGEAVTGEAQKGAVQVPRLNGGTLGGRDVRGIVALLAGQPGVSPLQQITGLAVVESLLRRFPMNQLEVLPIVL